MILFNVEEMLTPQELIIISYIGLYYTLTTKDD